VVRGHEDAVLQEGADVGHANKRRGGGGEEDDRVLVLGAPALSGLGEARGRGRHDRLRLASGLRAGRILSCS
jgi:hypothetical protein